MEFRKVFDSIPEQFDQWRPRYCEEIFSDVIQYAKLNADEFVLYTGTHCGHIALKEPYRTNFFEGARTAILDVGNKITLNDTIVLYLAKKP
jgi:hypothetical protein